jgi:thioredoxin 2
MNETPTQIVTCAACGAGNRIPAAGLGSAAARCGKCKKPLFAPKPGAAPGEAYKIRCAQCGARNRLPAARVDAGPKCGRCGAALPAEALFAPQPVIVNDGNFEDQVLKSPLPVLLFAWATWCPTCVAAAPEIDRFAADSRGRIRVAKVNVESSPALASRYNILSVPFLFVFDNGELKESMPGALQKHELMMKMARYV